MLSENQHVKGLLLTAFGVLILTPDSLLIRLIATDPFTLLFWRGLLSALAIIFFFFICYQKKAFTLFYAIGKPGVGAALCSTLSNILFVLSITNTKVANTLIIISITPLFSILLSRFFLKETAPLRTWIAISIAILGIGFVFSGSLEKGSLFGDLCALGTALTMASSFVLVRYARPRNMVPIIPLAGFLVALIIFPFASPFSPSTQDFIYLFILGFLILPISFGLITLGPRYLQAPEVSLLMLLETVLGPFWVWLVLKETPHSSVLLGGIIVLTTLILHSLASFRKSAY